MFWRISRLLEKLRLRRKKRWQSSSRPALSHFDLEFFWGVWNDLKQGWRLSYLVTYFCKLKHFSFFSPLHPLSPVPPPRQNASGWLSILWGSAWNKVPESAASAPYWALSSFNFCSNSFHKHHQKSSAGNNGPLFNCWFTLIPPSGIVWSFLNILDNIISLAGAISAFPLRSRSQWSVNKRTQVQFFIFIFWQDACTHRPEQA